MAITSGQWTFENSGLADVVYGKDSVGADRRICEMIGVDSESNGKAVAAVPTLLEVCELAEGMPEIFTTDYTDADVQRLQAWAYRARNAMTAAKKLATE